MSRYSIDPDFEPRVADWLEADPDLAPAPVLSTVLAAFPSIPQRRASRVPWRFQTMNRFALFGAAAALIVAAGLGSLAVANRTTVPNTVVGPTASPLASPGGSAARLTKTFSSPIYHYTIKYVPDWSVVPATLAVDGNPDAGDTTNDRFVATGTDTTIGVNATSLGGVSWQAYLDGVERDLQGDTSIAENCRPSQPWPTITVAGREGVRIIKCNNYQQVLVHVDDQAFMFWIGTSTFDQQQHLDAAYFDHMLESVTFEPPATP